MSPRRCRGRLTGGVEAGDRSKGRGFATSFDFLSAEISGVVSGEVSPDPSLQVRCRRRRGRSGSGSPPVSCLFTSCKMPAAAPLPNQRTRRTFVSPILHPAPPAARPNIFATYHHRSHRAIYARRLVYNGKEKRNEALRQKTRNAPERTQKPGRFIWPETQTLRPLERVRSEVS